LIRILTIITCAIALPVAIRMLVRGVELLPRRSKMAPIPSLVEAWTYSFLKIPYIRYLAISDNAENFIHREDYYSIGRIALPQVIKAHILDIKSYILNILSFLEIMGTILSATTALGILAIFVVVILMNLPLLEIALIVLLTILLNDGVFLLIVQRTRCYQSLSLEIPVVLSLSAALLPLIPPHSAVEIELIILSYIGIRLFFYPKQRIFNTSNSISIQQLGSLLRCIESQESIVFFTRKFSRKQQKFDNIIKFIGKVGNPRILRAIGESLANLSVETSEIESKLATIQNSIRQRAIFLDLLSLATIAGILWVSLLLSRTSFITSTIIQTMIVTAMILNTCKTTYLFPLHKHRFLLYINVAFLWLSYMLLLI